MDKKIKYDFSEINRVINVIKERETAVAEDLAILKNEFNRFFKDSKCKEVLYTTNIDKMFFGVKIIPVIDADEVYEILLDNEPRRIESYIVEIDSQLFRPVGEFHSDEIMAVLLHEISMLVGDSNPIENARDAVNAYLAGNREHIRISQSIHYKEILAYGLKDYLSKARSMFYTDDPSEIYADEMAVMYGYADSLATAYDKATHGNIKLYENANVSKFIVFSWTLTIYKNLKSHRVGALNVLNRSKLLTGSRLERMEIDNVIRRIGRIDDDALLEATSSVKAKFKEKMRKARLNNLRTIENTFYELNLQVRNVDEEQDALYLMRQINSSIAILEEYRNSADCDEYECQKIDEILAKFQQLREKLSATVTYKNKSYGLFINYPDIVENRY